MGRKKNLTQIWFVHVLYYKPYEMWFGYDPFSTTVGLYFNFLNLLYNCL